jgi:hypothetical protein
MGRFCHYRFAISSHQVCLEFMMDGVKFDNEKLRWSLLPLTSVQEVVQVLEYGATKYAPDNWMKVPDAQDRYWDAATRHIMAWKMGEKKDSETGKSHLAHAVCCLLYIMWFD